MSSDRSRYEYGSEPSYLDHARLASRHLYECRRALGHLAPLNAGDDVATDERYRGLRDGFRRLERELLNYLRCHFGITADDLCR
jgi:hypothetical protein